MPAHSSDSLVRRDFLKRSAAAGALLVGGVPLAGASANRRRSSIHRRSRSAVARNIIFMVADGMSIGTLTLADMFTQMHDGRATNWVELWRRPGVRRAMCETFSANALVTDSAAAATAWSIGHRVNNGAICVMPDGQDTAPLLVRAREHGLATGLVTTTRLTHATPAAFIANVPRRSQEADIAAQILDRGVDVALGGGWRHFSDQPIEEHNDLRLIRTREQMLAVNDLGSSRLLGLFSDSHMAYDIERPDDQPSLAEMTTTALKLLDQKNNGFLVQIEGGRVDHAAHNNDAPSLIRDQIAFDRALAVAVEFTSARDDTLLIVTTDHGNANPGLTLYGPRGIASFERLAAARHSFPWIASKIRRNPDPDAMSAIVEEATGISLPLPEQEILAGVARGERVHPFGPSNSLYPVLGGLLANHFGVAFASPNHTSDFVEVAALGPGSENLRPMTSLTGIHQLMTETIGLAANRED